MVRDAAVALIKQQLSFRQTMDATIVSYMQLAQTTLEQAPEKPWFLVSEDSFATTTANEERILLPPTFVEEVESARLYYRPAAWPLEDEVELVKEDYDQLKRDFIDEPAGPPQAYALLGNYFRFFPKPDAVYTIRLIFYKQDTVLTANVENGWLKHAPLLFMGSTLKLISQGPIRDAAAAKTGDEWIAVGTTLLAKQNVARDMANRESMQVGGRHW